MPENKIDNCCSHVGFLIDRDFHVQSVHFSHDSTFEYGRTECLGKPCYQVLWGKNSACPFCPLSTSDKSSSNKNIGGENINYLVHEGFFSHFQQGYPHNIDAYYSESLIRLPIDNESALILIEPLGPSSFTPNKNNSLDKSVKKAALHDIGNYHKKQSHHLSDRYNKVYSFGPSRPWDHSIMLSCFNFTATELEVVLRIMQGFSSKDIAEQLCVGKKATDFHRNNIRKKIGIVGRRISISNFLFNFIQEKIQNKS